MARAPGRPSAGNSPKKLILLLIVLVVLVIVAVVVLFGRGGSDTPATPTPNAAPPRGAGRPPGQPPRQTAANPPRRTTSPKPALSIQPPPPPSPEALQVAQNVDQYLQKYDETVTQNGRWDALGRWARENGLYVEAYHCTEPANVEPPQPWEVHDTTILLVSSDNRGQSVEHTFIEQRLFESQTALRPDFLRRSDRDEMVRNLEQLQPGGGSANQSRIASLLVQVDSPYGRQLYEQCIKEPHFYNYLARALEQAYFVGIQPGQEWQCSWYQTPPMNLWLIRQLIAFSPTETAEPTATPAGPHGQPGMPPGMPMPPGARQRPGQAAPDTPDAQHKMLMARILVRRGGLVSSKLIGELFAADEKGTIVQAIAQGQLPPQLLCRFSGIYAEGFLEQAGQTLSRYKPAMPEWTTLAEILAGTFNSRAQHFVFASAEAAKATIGDALALRLAVTGQPYPLENLLAFANSGNLSGLDLPVLWSIWTRVDETADESFWDWISTYIPLAWSSETGPAADLLQPGSPGGMANPNDPMMGMGMPPEGYAPPSMPGMPGGTPPRPRATPRHPNQPSTAKDSGWPVKMAFKPTVDAQAAKQFLLGLAQTPAAESAEQNPKGQPNRPGMPPHGAYGGPPGARGAQPYSPTQVKQDAVRALASLYDGSLRVPLRELIGDPQAGDMARLALCMLNDREGCAKILEQFWKETTKPPFGLGPAGDGKAEQVRAYPGKLAVPLLPSGLAKTGVTAREALIYFDYNQASEAFLAAMNLLNLNREPFDQPEPIADGACQVIDALGRWRHPDAATAMADVVESTGDFGLRGRTRSTDPAAKSPEASRVRRRALQVLGQIGNQQAVDIILRIATYNQEDPEMLLAARIALAKRGVTTAFDLFLDILDPDKASMIEQMTGPRGNYSQIISEIDPAMKDLTDVALLAATRTRMTDLQTNRALDLVRKLGETANNNRRDTTGLQERLVLALIENNDPRLLNHLAALIAETPQQDSPAGQRLASQSADPYYWNNRQPKDQDQDLLKMIRVLDQRNGFIDENAVYTFAKAVIIRDESNLLPADSELAQFKLEDYLIKFEDAQTNSGQRRTTPAYTTTPPAMPPGMPQGIPPEILRQMQGAPVPGTPAAPRTTGRRGAPQPPVAPFAAETHGATTPTLAFEAKSLNRLAQAPQEAAEAAMRLIADLKDAQFYLPQMHDRPYYRYHAMLQAGRLGAGQAAEDKLVEFLAGWPREQSSQYLRTAAVEYLQNHGGLSLLVALGKAAGQENAAGSLWRLRLLDAAAIVVKNLWEAQMAGAGTRLSNPQLIAPVAQAYKPLAEQAGPNSELGARLVIILAACQTDAEAIDRIHTLIRDCALKSQPIPEDAVGHAVQIIRGLNPSGSMELVELYSDILDFTSTQRNDNVRDLRNARATGAAARRSAPQTTYAYTAIGPMIIDALAAMDLPEAHNALLQLARSRTDLLGHIAIAVHRKDPDEGLRLMEKTLIRSSRSDEMVEPARMILVYLAATPNEETLGLIAKGTVKGDAAVTDTGLQILEKILEAGAPGLDMTDPVKHILSGLATQVAPGSAKAAYLDRIIALGRQFAADADVSRLVERLETIKKRPAVQRRR